MSAIGFEVNFPATAYNNQGSPMYPVTMPELCDHGYGFPRVYPYRWTYDAAGDKVTVTEAKAVADTRRAAIERPTTEQVPIDYEWAEQVPA